MLAKWAALCGSIVPLLTAQAPSGLRTEYLSDPVGIDVQQPRFA